MLAPLIQKRYSKGWYIGGLELTVCLVGTAMTIGSTLLNLGVASLALGSVRSIRILSVLAKKLIL